MAIHKIAFHFLLTVLLYTWLAASVYVWVYVHVQIKILTLNQLLIFFLNPIAFLVVYFKILFQRTECFRVAQRHTTFSNDDDDDHNSLWICYQMKLLVSLVPEMKPFWLQKNQTAQQGSEKRIGGAYKGHSLVLWHVLYIQKSSGPVTGITAKKISVSMNTLENWCGSKEAILR